MPNRRDFLKTTTAAGGVLLTGGLPALARAASSRGRARRGPAQPARFSAARASSDRTSFATQRRAATRSRSSPAARHEAELPGDVVRLQGDRNGQLGALEGKTWDAVVDDSATNPEYVKLSTALLKNSVGAYLFTSSTGVFYPYLKRGVDESTPVHYDARRSEGRLRKVRHRQGAVRARDAARVRRPRDRRAADVHRRSRRHERSVSRIGRSVSRRAAKCSRPGRRDDPMQIIDVRDLAEFMVRLLENKKTRHLQRRRTEDDAHGEGVLSRRGRRRSRPT